MRKFVATAAVAASAAATIAMTPLAAHSADVPPNSEIRTGCQNGVTGWYTNPSGNSHGFELVPGTQWKITDGDSDTDAGLWQFFINQPNSLEAYGPALGADRSFEFAHQRVEKAVVNVSSGAEHIYFNDRANAFQFNVPKMGEEHGAFSVYYQCGIGKS